MNIEFYFFIDALPATVFEAISTKIGYENWWAQICDVDCNVGKLSSIRFEKEDVIEEMCFKTIKREENKELVWECVKNNVFLSWIGSTLQFTMKQEGAGTAFRFVHNSPVKEWSTHPEYGLSVAGWNFFMESLKKYCETGVGEPWG